MNHPQWAHRPPRLLAVALVLLLTFWSAVSSLKQKSPTFDEQGFIVRGLAYLRPAEQGGTRRLHVGHPPGLNAYNALLLARDETVALPVQDPSWQGTSFHRPAELFLWEIGNNVEHTMFLSRIQTVWLGLLLIALIGRWAAQLAGSGLWEVRGVHKARNAAGLLAILLAAFDPNLLAHMRLATTDFGLTATAALAGYGIWRLARKATWQTAVLAAVGVGLMLNTKFTALLFIPFFGLTMLVVLAAQWRGAQRGSGERPWQLLLLNLVLFPVWVLLTLWATSLFDVGLVPDGVPVVGGATLPLANYLEQLLDIGGRLQVATPSYLLGQYSSTGWWTYFPTAFLLKTPLPTLILILGAFVVTGVSLWSRRKQLTSRELIDLLGVLLPAFGFLAIALTSDINLGYRHILPVLPFLFVFTGAGLGSVLARESGREQGWRTAASWAVVGLTAALALVSFRIYPHYLAYFNVLAGGPDNGWQALADSNIDWGQDLAALGPWMAEHGVDTVWLSYFGEGRPEHYGIKYQGLDSFPPRLMDPAARPFFPADPAPGWYAISATNLLGIHFLDHDEFKFFRDRPPDDKLGYSIFLYDVPARGEPVNLILDGLQPDEIAPEDWAQLGTNDVSLRWIDGAQVMMQPTDGRPTWLMSKSGSELSADWQDVLANAQQMPTAVVAGYSLWRLPASEPQAITGGLEFRLGDGRIALLDSTQLVRDDAVLTVVSDWQQGGDPQPVKIFVHVLDDDGQIVAQWDGLGAAWQGWREGDVLRQRRVLGLPDDLPAGTYRVVGGLYDPATLERWRLSTGADFVELRQVTIP